MPEYLYPGVYVEEVSFQSKPIEGVSTTSTGFIGPTRQGPVGKASAAITSFVEFEQSYGDTGAINGRTNFLAHSARAFFANGGARLFVVRVPNNPSRKDYQSALAELGKVKEISIIAAPGHAELNLPIADLLIGHAEKIRSRIAVLETPSGLAPNPALQYKSKFNSSFAALYYPWVTGPDGASLPPTGFVCGIYVRSDLQRGVQKAPANEVVQSATGLERVLTDADADRLNNGGVNCIRQFPARGILVWGARTLSSDPEWKYVNVRRLLIYLEHSIAVGTQWVVFEPNGEALWLTVCARIENFLLTQWQGGALTGVKAEEAFIVKCGRDTMTQNDIDRGRLVCLVGVAVLKPAEFVIFRISWQTKKAKKKKGR